MLFAAAGSSSSRRPDRSSGSSEVMASSMLCGDAILGDVSVARPAHSFLARPTDRGSDGDPSRASDGMPAGVQRFRSRGSDEDPSRASDGMPAGVQRFPSQRSYGQSFRVARSKLWLRLSPRAAASSVHWGCANV